MSSTTENVLAIPRDLLTSAHFANGAMLGETAGPVIARILAEGRFLPRQRVERDATLLQPIPCTLVRAGASFLTLRRGESKKSSPLHGRYVIWVGGHVHREDSDDSDDFLKSALNREVEEELGITLGGFQFVGIISPANSLHFAVVFQALISEALVDLVAPNEEFLRPKRDRGRIKFCHARDLTEKYSRLDLWSQVIMDEVLQFRSQSPTIQRPLWRSDGRYRQIL